MDALRYFLTPRYVIEYSDLLVSGLLVTLRLSVLTFLLALLPGLAVALLRRLGPAWLSTPLTLFVNALRSVPSVIAVVFIYLALPFMGLTFSAFNSVLISIVTMQIVYFSEVFRGALAAVDRGQFEAAYACGMRTPLVLRKVVLPQAAVIAAPAFASSVVLLVQNTSIATAVALNDLIGSALTVQTITGQPSPLVAVGLVYLILLLPIVRLSRGWERRAARAFA